MRSTLVAVFLLVPAAVATPPAAAEVRRCAMPDGNTVYTDRSCQSLGAVELSREASVHPATRLYHGRCAATLPDLLYEVTSAIDGHDVNRLAASYHWPGLSGSAANATMDRLDAIASRPLLDLRLVTADLAPGPASDGLPDPGGPDDVAAAPEVRVVPTGLRADQVLGDGKTQVSTRFSLRRHLGCWWVRL